MMTEPKREDYGSLEEWTVAFESYVKQAQASSKMLVLRQKLLAVQVCAPADMVKEELEAEANRISPTGIASKWAVEAREDNPVQCAEDSGRRHWILVC